SSSLWVSRTAGISPSAPIYPRRLVVVRGGGAFCLCREGRGVAALSTAPANCMCAASGAIIPRREARHGLSNDARHAFIDLVTRRVGWHRQLRQPLLPRARQQTGAPWWGTGQP